MKILGLDLSLTSTGFYYLGNDEEEGGVIVPKKLEGVRRLDYLRAELESIIVAYNPELVVIEGYSYGSMMSRAHSIGEWGGLARWILYCQDLRTLVVPPQTLKQFVTGKGSSKKEDMKMWAFKRWGKEFKTNDECDAYCLATMGHALWRADDFDLSEPQRKALSKVEIYFEGGLKASDFQKLTARKR